MKAVVYYNAMKHCHQNHVQYLEHTRPAMTQQYSVITRKSLTLPTAIFKQDTTYFHVYRKSLVKAVFPIFSLLPNARTRNTTFPRCHRQDYTVACLNYTLQTMMPLPGWPVMASKCIWQQQLCCQNFITITITTQSMSGTFTMHVPSRLSPEKYSTGINQ